MRIALMASGTRGDVQPMLALGKALRQAGHTVQVIAGSNFTAWIEGHGLEVYPTFDMEALMQSDLGIQWVESPSQLAQLRTMKALTNQVLDRVVEDTIRGTEGAELLIGGFLTEPYLQAIAEHHGIPQISVGLQPYRATRSGAASLLALRPRRNSAANRWMGIFADRIMWSVAQKTTGVLRATLDLPTHTATSYHRAARNIPALYAMSKHVVPPISDANAHTTGYWFLHEEALPSEALRRFIEAGDSPVYIGFGSMPSSDPSTIERLVADALRQTGQRGIIARGWNKAIVADLPDHIFLVDNVAHSWLFPRMAALVHHGGAGTTAAGLHAGKPTLVVPHMADQPYWGRRVFELGVGARPIPRARLTTARLADAITVLVNDTRIGAKAAALGASIRAEQGVNNAVNWISEFIAR